MIEPVTFTEQLLYTTARIEATNPSKKLLKTGTGFFYKHIIDDTTYIPLLFTNKHVISDTTVIRFLSHLASTKTQKIPEGNILINAPPDQWTGHPDPKIDLAAVPLGSVASQHNLFIRSLGPELIPTQQQLEALEAVEDVLMVGYPNGLWDAKNNYPLIRRGITSSHPASDHNVGGVNTTVIDIACFPGSSGSPVFLHNKSGYTDKQGNMHIGAARSYFLGVLYSGPMIQADGNIVIQEIPTAAVPVAQVNLMMNLGYIIKAKHVSELVDIFVEAYKAETGK